MKVWVVLQSDAEEGDTVAGVFSNERDASVFQAACPSRWTHDEFVVQKRYDPLPDQIRSEIVILQKQCGAFMARARRYVDMLRHQRAMRLGVERSRLLASECKNTPVILHDGTPSLNDHERIYYHDLRQAKLDAAAQQPQGDGQ